MPTVPDRIIEFACIADLTPNAHVISALQLLRAYEMSSFNQTIVIFDFIKTTEMENLTVHDDKEMLLLVAEGDKSAFTQLFKKYTPKLVPFVSELTKSDFITDEIIQETFMRVWFNREKLMSVNDIENWIFRITAGACYRFLKELMVENKITNFVRHESYYGNNEVLESVRLYKLAADIRHAIRKLSPEQKKVYRLSREQGLKIPEIAEELALSPNSVRKLLNSSIESVQDYLQEKEHSF